MTLLYYDPVFMEHQTGDHPESPKRLLPLTRHLSFLGLDSACARPSWQLATREQLEAVHTTEHVNHVEQSAANGGGWLDADTRVSAHSFNVARSASGALCDAVDRVVSGEDTTAFCLSRPPGHHATQAKAMGFCLFNHVAVAAKWAIDRWNLNKVLIVDFDVHHGNGTQDIFYRDPAVGYLSMHRTPFYPHTGHADETGEGPGLGATLNVPIEIELDRELQMIRFEESVHQFADTLGPDLIFASAGFDAHANDPIGSLGWETEDFGHVAEILLSVAGKHCGGKLISVLEGGYDAEALCDSATLYLEKLLEA